MNIYEVVIRGILGTAVLLIYTRLLGKQQVSELSYFDYILGITIGSIAASFTVDLTTNRINCFVGITVWAAAAYIMQYAVIKSRRLSKLIDGQPVVAVMDGRILEDNLKKARYRVMDILEMLREKDVFDPSEVAFAILETDGELSVLKKPEFQNVKASDLNIKNEKMGIGREVVFNGEIVKQNLEEAGKTKEWLVKSLDEKNIESIGEVFIALLYEGDKLYVDTYRDHFKKLIDIGDFKGLG